MEAIKNKINLVRTELPKDSLSGVDVRFNELNDLILDKQNKTFCSHQVRVRHIGDIIAMNVVKDFNLTKIN